MEQPLIASGHALLEKLTGAFLDGTPAGAMSPSERLRMSVADHIRRLLETRRGMLSHMPEFGMPDMGELFRRLPGSASEIQEGMETLIGNYEPRMKNVRVEFQEFDAARARIRFRITGVLTGVGRIRLESSLFPSGRGEVRSSN